MKMGEIEMMQAQIFSRLAEWDAMKAQADACVKDFGNTSPVERAIDRAWEKAE